MSRKKYILSAITACIFGFNIAHSEISNISTRGLAGNGDNKMIAGFNISGNDSLKVAIIAGGPTLTAFNVPNVLNDPKLTVYDSTGAIIVSNDSWANYPEIAASSTVPQDDKEAGVVLTLEPGSYTVHVESADGQELGNAIVAIENIDTTSGSSLSNISTRGQVGSGDEQMIAGFILKGSPQQLVIVAAGPTLADFGVSNVLADPLLSLQDTSGRLLASNDNWANNADVAATSIRPAHATEAAIVTTLAAGSYTIVVGGANGQTGNAIIGVEDYATSLSHAQTASCVNLSLPAEGNVATLEAINLAIGDQIGSGIMTTTVESVSDTQTTTVTTGQFSAEGISFNIDSSETENYSISNNRLFVENLSLSGTFGTQGFTIPFDGTTSYSPALTDGPINVVCLGDTWTAPAVTEETILNGELTSKTLPSFNGKVLSISESISVAAGTFSTVKTERVSVENTIYQWVDVVTNLLIKQETINPADNSVISSITATRVN